MRIKKKLLVGLALIGCSTGLMGLTSCNKNKEKTKDPQIQEIYQAYVSNTTAAGEQPLKYEDWLKTIKGADGKDGTNGLSAFEIYKKYHPEFKGTEEDWINSLGGATGSTGKSAYEIAKEHGYTGTEVEWLQTLVGSTGSTGKSAYEIAKEHGYTGTEVEWLQTLVGSTGSTGKSAYEIAKEHGYTGTETEWIQSLVGSTGAQGTGIQDIDVAIEINSSGEQVTIFTFQLTDGSSIVKRVVTPKVIRNFLGFMETRFPMISATAPKPKFIAQVEYTDGTTGQINITEDMIVRSNIDYTQEGVYEVVISLNNQEYSVQIDIYDPSRRDLVQAYLINTNSLLWLQSEVEQQTITFGQIEWYLEYSNNTFEKETMMLDQIDFTAIEGTGEVQVPVHYGDYTDYLQVYVCEDSIFTTLEASNQYCSINSLVCEINQSIDFERQKGYITQDYILEDRTYMYYTLLTTNDLVGFDPALGGMQEIELANGLGHIQVFVYDSFENKMNAYLEANAVRVTESFPELYLNVSYHVEYQYENGASLMVEISSNRVLLTPEMIEGDVDFTTIGRKEFLINYEGQSLETYLEVYDPTICNIAYLGVSEYNHNLVIGQTEEDLKNVLINQDLIVEFFEPENDKYDTIVQITNEMLDCSSVDFNEAGRYNFYIEYRGYRLELEVVIEMDLSTEEVAYALNNDQNITMVLYVNGYAVLYDTQCKYQLFDENQAIKIQDLVGNTLAVFGIDLEQGTYFEYDFSSKTPLHIYSCTFGSDVLTIYLYENNIGYGEQSGYQSTCGYVIENNQLFLYTPDGVSKFIIDGDTIYPVN